MRPASRMDRLWPVVVLSCASAIVVLAVAAALFHGASMMLDDGYYYLQIAWQFSRGNGSTFDGINPTNGYHPLWMFLLLPVFWTGMGKASAIGAATLLQTTGFVASGWALYACLRRSAGRGIALTAACSWLLNSWLWNKAAVSGLETGVLTAAFGCALWLLVRLWQGTASAWWLGIALATTVAARIDSLPFALGAVLVLAATGRRRQAVRAAVPALVFTVAYLTANTLAFGHPLPVSGQIKSADGHELLVRLFSDGDPEVFRHLWRNVSGLATANHRLPVAVLLLPLAWLALAWRSLDSAWRCVLATATLYVAGLLGYYGTMYGSLVSAYTYYFIPMLYLAHACAFAWFATFGRKQVRAALAVASALGIAVFSSTYLYFRLQLADFRQAGAVTPKERAVSYLNTELPPDAIVGCWDAGEMGYRVARPVVNLDGLVNSFEFQRARKEEGLASYIRRVGITHLVNHDPKRRAFVVDELGWEPCYDFRQTVPPRVTPFSINPGFSAYGKPHESVYWGYRRPDVRSDRDEP